MYSFSLPLSRLLQSPEAPRLFGGFNLTREELAELARKICKEYRLYGKRNIWFFLLCRAFEETRNDLSGQQPLFCSCKKKANLREKRICSFRCRSFA